MIVQYTRVLRLPRAALLACSIVPLHAKRQCERW
jgi:hypothetical protein